MMNKYTIGAVVLIAVSAGTLLTACSSSNTSNSVPGVRPVATGCEESLTLVISVDQNTAAPGIPSTLKPLLEDAVENRRPISIVQVDGTPAMVMTNATFEVSSTNPAAHDDDVAAGVNAVTGAIRTLKADSDGNDTLAGISLAADAARGAALTCSNIVLLGMGNSDRGDMNVTVPGFTSADPAETANALVAAPRRLPDMTGGFTVNLIGVGYAAEGSPQVALPQAQRDNLVAIYKKAFETAGASVSVYPTPRTGAGPDTPFRTTPIPVDAATPINFCTTTPLIFDNSSSLGFVEGRTDFRHPAAATATMSSLATWLKADPSRTATITGTTANWGSTEYQLDLSTRRASASESLATSAGARSEQLHTSGVGSDFPEHRYEYMSDGTTLDPIIANANRSIRLTLSNPAGNCR